MYICVYGEGLWGGACHGGCGKDCCCAVQGFQPQGSSCWSTVNLTFSIINMTCDLIVFLLLIAEDGQIGWWILFMIEVLFTAGHFKMWQNLQQVSKIIPHTFQGAGGVIAYHGAPHHHVHNSISMQQNVSYCPSCGGVFMIPIPTPPQIACPHCHYAIMLNNQPSRQIQRVHHQRHPSHPSQFQLQQQPPPIPKQAFQQPQSNVNPTVIEPESEFIIEPVTAGSRSAPKAQFLKTGADLDDVKGHDLSLDHLPSIPLTTPAKSSLPPITSTSSSLPPINSRAGGLPPIR